MPGEVMAALNTDPVLDAMKSYINRPDNPRPREWLETMLAFACNLLSQAWDQCPENAVATTGPDGDPDRYDIPDFLEEVRKHYPRF